jgi:isoaspartyl peptidase/L-asparaginase-like protein (Ntn-hydrolase superfamily)
MADVGGLGWALVVHGGAKEIAPEQQEAHRDGCFRALAAGRAVLERGGSAVEAVEASIRVLEDDPTFNAGVGSDRDALGDIAMDAGLMDGATLDVGAVGAVEGLRHPITVARLLLREPPTLLVADGAKRFAAEHGAETADTRELIELAERGPEAGQRRDTVGCVALDAAGHLAAGTSTGGLSGSPPGRVGDSPLPGCGLYADDRAGAVALSGDGESIVRVMLAARVVRDLEAGQHPQVAIEAALGQLGGVGGEAGGIVLDRQGRVGWAHNSPHISVGYHASGVPEPRVRLSRGEAEARGDG